MKGSESYHVVRALLRYYNIPHSLSPLVQTKEWSLFVLHRPWFRTKTIVRIPSDAENEFHVGGKWSPLLIITLINQSSYIRMMSI